MSDIFISYSRKDEQFVHRLVGDLSRDGRKVFFDLNLRPGQHYDKVLSQELEQAKFVLVVLSPDSLVSSGVQAEVQKALQQERDGLTTVVPLLIKQCDPQKLENLIGTKIYANFTVDYDTGFKELAGTLDEPVPKAIDHIGKSRMRLSKGIVAIITACVAAIATLITGYWQFVYKPRHDQVVQYAGRIMDAATQRVISGAKVSVATQGVPEVYYSDSDGVFYLRLPGSTQSAQIRVEATGYNPFDRNVSLSRTGIEDIRLSPMNNGDATGKPTPAPTRVKGESASDNPNRLQTEPYNRP